MGGGRPGHPRGRYASRNPRQACSSRTSCGARRVGRMSTSKFVPLSAVHKTDPRRRPGLTSYHVNILREVWASEPPYAVALSARCSRADTWSSLTQCPFLLSRCDCPGSTACPCSLRSRVGSPRRAGASWVQGRPPCTSTVNLRRLSLRILSFRAAATYGCAP